jgi:pimeloyl-ACP methyl ester carboxylesterase
MDSSLKSIIISIYAKALVYLRLLAWKSWTLSVIGIAIGILTAGVLAGNPRVKVKLIISEDINDLSLLVFKRSVDGLLHPEPLFLDHQGLVNPHLDVTKETKILIHGWKTALEYAERFIHDYLEVGDYNVIIVDWSLLSTWDSYTTSAENSVTVGNYIGQIFAQVLNPELMHVIGHSLGAHAAGHLGRRFEAIRRISGLDPAKHWFDFQEEFGFHLNKHDAKFVDVIHSNSGELWEVLD